MADTNKKPTRKRGVVLALLLTLIAVATVAAAVVWAGGIEGVAELVGLEGLLPQTEVAEPTPSRPNDAVASEDTTTPTPSVVPTSPAEETTTVPEPVGEDTDSDDSGGGGVSASAFPYTAAQAAMYREQLQSQINLEKLVNNEFSSFTMGTTTISGSKATVPLTANFRAGGTYPGTMTLLNSDGNWYMNVIAHSVQSAPVKPRTVDAGVVAVISSQQGSASNQTLLRTGVIENGFKSARVDGVTRGSGTATVNVTLMGGSLDRRAARFVLISKIDSGKKYWFVTRFELK